jgi:hypothetical protein
MSIIIVRRKISDIFILILNFDLHSVQALLALKKHFLLKNF